MQWKRTIKPLDLRGQATRLQALDSIVGPRPLVAQSRPPLDGAGLSQVRYLCITPPPHVTSHADQSLHLEYPPSSVNHENKNAFEENSTGQVGSAATTKNVRNSSDKRSYTDYFYVVCSLWLNARENNLDSA